MGFNAVSRTQKILDTLRAYESRNVLFVEADGSWPIVWERAQGVYVWGANGKKYLDLTAAFGVAAAGHATPRVVKAGQQQMGKLLHAMGDVHPHELKAKLARELSRITFERWTKKKPLTGKTIFCNSGFEAVEAALKTARLATGKPGIIAFKQAYHGLGYGALNATHREHFRAPFRNQLSEFGQFVDYPTSSKDLTKLKTDLRKIFRTHKTGAILVEPLQARGGINVPPKGFLPLLRQLCNESGALLILDEIYTGFGRTGKWFAAEHSQTVPDLICLGKALTGGFPLSACVGQRTIMDSAWPASTGEAIHTSTFLGHPVGCAMALAQIREISAKRLCERSHASGNFFLKLLQKLRAPRAYQLSARGNGLMLGVELRHRDESPATVEALDVIKRLLHQGFILLPEGEHANIVSFTPPLTISRHQMSQTVTALQKTLNERLGK